MLDKSKTHLQMFYEHLRLNFEEDALFQETIPLLDPNHRH